MFMSLSWGWLTIYKRCLPMIKFSTRGNAYFIVASGEMLKKVIACHLCDKALIRRWIAWCDIYKLHKWQENGDQILFVGLLYFQVSSHKTIKNETLLISIPLLANLCSSRTSHSCPRRIVCFNLIRLFPINNT